jgi:hypothetical protein
LTFRSRSTPDGPVISASPFSPSRTETTSPVDSTYGKRQFVATERVDLSVEFAEEVFPAQLRWFVAAFPIGDFPAGFNFPPAGNVIEAGPGRRYEKTFLRTELPGGRIVGMMWDY